MWWLMVSVSALVGVGVALEIDVDLKPTQGIDCVDARVKCAYRVGCGMALQNYIVGCSTVLQGPYVDFCPEVCQHALIALTSTPEGQELMSCQCNDNFCEDAKRRLEICRPQVMMANRNETVVSCRVAKWICAADIQCTTALEYYNRYCRSMFHGKKCNHRCQNSISILMRQEKAAKLKTCKCDGLEDFDCEKIQRNMAKLCFHRKETEVPDTREETNVNRKESDASSASTFGGSLAVLLVQVSLVAFLARRT